MIIIVSTYWHELVHYAVRVRDLGLMQYARSSSRRRCVTHDGMTAIAIPMTWLEAVVGISCVRHALGTQNTDTITARHHDHLSRPCKHSSTPSTCHVFTCPHTHTHIDAFIHPHGHSHYRRLPSQAPCTLHSAKGGCSGNRV